MIYIYNYIYIYGHLHLKTLALTPKDSKKKTNCGSWGGGEHIYIYIFIDYIRLYNLVQKDSKILQLYDLYVSNNMDQFDSLRPATQRVYVGCSQIHGGLSSGAPL